MDVRAVLKVYRFTNKHNQVNLKISREMMKELAWYWCFLPNSYDMFISLSQRGKVCKAPKYD